MQAPTSSQTSPGCRLDVPCKHGITDPISLQESAEADEVLSDRMMEELQAAFPSETQQGLANRRLALQEVERAIIEWTRSLGLEMGLTGSEAIRWVRVVTFGSFRLGVIHPKSGIDALCIGPPHVSRDDFFTSGLARLRRHEHVTACVPVDGHTCIRLKMRGVNIDLLFARLAQPMDGDPDEAIRDDQVLQYMDDQSLRCMSGYRVADQILELVPNQESFRRTLRFVMCWARRRGIHSEMLGFFGTITWALLVARVCQLYPCYAPNQLVNRFFRVYDQWNWSKPVMLREIVEPQNVPGMAGLKVWNPKMNPTDRQHVMPVVTPAFPAMNSNNVTETTKRILLDEFSRGYGLVKNIEAQKSEWSEVHEPAPFFARFRQFLWLEVLAKTDEVHQKFRSWVESKLRLLTSQLEAVSGMIIHPNPEQYDLAGTDSEWPLGFGMFIAMAFFKDQGAYAGQTVDLRGALSQFVDVINQWSEKDVYPEQFLLRLRRIRGSELPSYVRSDEPEPKRVRVSSLI
mmetsp:Transcript_32500/g.87267  ORF Transcript_32500/g.87267 Transcript_32500/m.87267 type:complete len:515 (-) Transcript_32500:47-1591(-)